MKETTPAGFFGPGGLLARSMPGWEHRPEQGRMAEAVASAIARCDVCLVEAGTGVGKTLAYLVPALLSGRQTVVATGTRALMDQIHGSEIPRLRDLLETPFRDAVLKGRGNYLCAARLDAEWDSLDLDGPARRLLVRLRAWDRATDTGDLAELADLPEGEPLLRRLVSTPDTCPGRSCGHFGHCHLFQARARAREADVVLTTHHLFFADLAGRDESGTALLPPDAVLVFDEAHGLEDVATDHFGRSLSSHALAELAKDAATLAKRGDPHGARVLLGAASRLVHGFGTILAGLASGDGRAEVRPERLPPDAATAWHVLDDELEVVAHESVERAEALGFDTDVAARARRAQQTLASVLADADDAMVRVVDRKGRGGTLSALPVEVAGRLRRDVFLTARSIVLTSATLTVGGSTSFLRARLGVPEGAEESILASPFDYPRQALLYLPGDLPDPGEAAYADAFADRAAQVLDATRGRAFLLFTSHAMLDRVRDRMRPTLAWPLLSQGDAPRDELLRRFRETPGACLFGTATFWEGVDVVGPALSCVIIDRLPFDPPDDPVTRARAEALRARGEDRFRDYLLPLAVIRLRQGFGRLIRSRSDRGVVAVLDPRIVTRSYGKVFLDSLPPAPRTADLDELRTWCRRNLRERRAGKAKDQKRKLVPTRNV